jgi:hypothetical protein
LTTLSALNRNFDALAHSRRLRSRDSREAFVLGLLARFASFRFVLEALVVEEYLLSSSPDKVLVTIYASYCTVLILTIEIRFQSGRGFHLCHDLTPSGPLNLETTFRRGIKNHAPKTGHADDWSTNEARFQPVSGCCLANWYITMAKLCQGKTRKIGFGAIWVTSPLVATLT